MAQPGTCAYSARKTKGPMKGPLIFLAEKAGFEPAVRYKRTLAFQASALSHSATSPDLSISCRSIRSAANRCMANPRAAAVAGSPAATASLVMAPGHPDHPAFPNACLLRRVDIFALRHKCHFRRKPIRPPATPQEPVDLYFSLSFRTLPVRGASTAPTRGLSTAPTA